MVNKCVIVRSISFNFVHISNICVTVEVQPYKLLCIVQVYLLLDEFIMGGELQETSKKVSVRCLRRFTMPWHPCRPVSMTVQHSQAYVAGL